MNTLPFEKAKALKDAGFPQPEFSFGQRWYDDSFSGPELCVFAQIHKSGDKSFFYTSFSHQIDYPDCSDFVYIPTEGELFAALNEPDWIITNDTDEYWICDTWAGTIDGSIAKGATLIDALTNAYLEKNGKAKKTSEEADV